MKTQQCAPLKHHYDECAERVHSQHEQHGKAHEDCVEECKSCLVAHGLMATVLIHCFSLPPHALRQPMRRAQAVQAAAVELGSISFSDHAAPPEGQSTRLDNQHGERPAVQEVQSQTITTACIAISIQCTILQRVRLERQRKSCSLVSIRIESSSTPLSSPACSYVSPLTQLGECRIRARSLA